MPSTEWRPIPGWPDYTVSNEGHVRLVETLDGWLPEFCSRDRRHLCVILDRLSRNNALGDREAIMKPLATLVLETFHGPRPTSTSTAVWLDGDRTNNSSLNLRWTGAEPPIPEDAPFATRSAVRAHRRAYSSTPGKTSPGQVA